jgi:hypothetical protein
MQNPMKVSDAGGGEPVLLLKRKVTTWDFF